jgi:TRAP-type C4-dicarboxylate transport system permease small subunit
MSDDSASFLQHHNDSRDVRLLLDVTSALVAAIVLITFIQVTLRFGFNSPQAWAEEISRYLFVWISMLGAAVAFSRDTHIRLNSLVELLPRAAQKPLDILRRVIDAAVVVFLLYSGTLVTWNNRSSVFYTLQGVPQVLYYAAVPTGAALMLFYSLRGLARQLRD